MNSVARDRTCLPVALFALTLALAPAHGQALYTPGGTVGDNTTNGNVGVATSAPNSKLQVHGVFGVTYDGTTSHIIDNSDTVRIGVYPSGPAHGYIQAPYNKSFFIWNHGTYGIVEFKDNRDSVFYGNVGIGTTAPSHKLSVNGTIKTKEIIVETTGWADDVFAEGYRLKALGEVEAFIAENKHLPDVPSAAAVAEQGVAVGEMQATLLRKIEELTLYLIEQEKRSREQELGAEASRRELTARIERLERENAQLRASQ